MQSLNVVETRPLKNVHFCSRLRKTKILTTVIHGVFRGLKFESDTELGKPGTQPTRLGSELREEKWDVFQSFRNQYQAVGKVFSSPTRILISVSFGLKSSLTSSTEIPVVRPLKVLGIQA
jgi:hypothetical protein